MAGRYSLLELDTADQTWFHRSRGFKCTHSPHMPRFHPQERQHQGGYERICGASYSENQQFAPENRPFQKETSLSTVIFRFYASLREGNPLLKGTINLAQKGKGGSSCHIQTNRIQELVELSTLTRWFKVTFSSPTWRSLNPSKGSLNHPQKVTLNHQVVDSYGKIIRQI